MPCTAHPLDAPAPTSCPRAQARARPPGGCTPSAAPPSAPAAAAAQWGDLFGGGLPTGVAGLWGNSQTLWGQYGMALAEGAWLAGFWAAPASWAVVAVCRLDLLHACYLAAAALQCAGAVAVAPAPGVPAPRARGPRHRLIRRVRTLLE